MKDIRNKHNCPTTYPIAMMRRLLGATKSAPATIRHAALVWRRRIDKYARWGSLFTTVSLRTFWGSLATHQPYKGKGQILKRKCRRWSNVLAGTENRKISNFASSNQDTYGRDRNALASRTSSIPWLGWIGPGLLQLSEMWLERTAEGWLSVSTWPVIPLRKPTCSIWREVALFLCY